MKYVITILVIIIPYILSNTINNEIITLKKENTIILRGENSENLISNSIYNLTNIKKNDIYIYIDSKGGDVQAGNKFIEAIEFYKFKKNITCIAHYAASMAFIILQNCPNRYSSSKSTLMQHPISISINNQKNNIKNYIQSIEHI